ncbi:ankyrin repeat-containing domain protein [Mycena latifolia]|nr:ankyrin repeat-containing domain protein [Mycena latifolia]
MKQKQRDMEKLRKDGTGCWFLQGDRFMEWQDNSGLLWIEATSGSGKTVLSATVIKELFATENPCGDSRRPPAVAFFYFTFRSDVEIVLRRIVLKLSAQSPDPYRALNDQYKLSSGQKLPSYQDLHNILEQLLRELGRTYIVLDALDECDDGDFNKLVDLISSLGQWKETPLHVLITSQPRKIFSDAFNSITRITLESDVVQKDIELFITSELDTNSDLASWRPHAVRVREGITRKSHRMFRLAACLLVELSRCPWADEEELDKTLQRLPDDLFGIYDRFIQAIPPRHLIYVGATLRWIMFAFNGMSLAELMDAIAFDFNNPAQYIYKPTRREGNIAITKWLAGLVAGSSGDLRVIVLAHASVRDYLLSTHFKDKFALDLSENVSHTFMARTCISYFQYFSDHPVDEARDGDSLALYATKYWCQHLRASHERDVLFGAAMELLELQSSRLVRLNRKYGFPSTPLQVCCREGYIKGVRRLLANGADVNTFETNFGYGRSPLALASENGYTDIVSLLLKSGADVNWQGCYDTMLSRACRKGQIEMVRLLLESGANIDAQDGRALRNASSRGDMEIVHLLLKNGANINLACNALGAACSAGNMKIVRFLLEAGADIDLRDEHYGSALGAASAGGHMKIVHLLLKKGADINLQGGTFGSALGAAAINGELKIIQLLLKNGANVNLQGGEYGSALACAAYTGKKETIQLLLQNGADVNLQLQGRVLACTAYAGKKEIIQLLLQNGTDFNLRGGEYGTALVAAYISGDKEIARVLLDSGADVSILDHRARKWCTEHGLAC